jgi:hypothetical protein
MEPNQTTKFYSRFSLQKSQPYLLTHEFDCNGMKIPGMQWVPDFSMWNVNKPNFPSGPMVPLVPPTQKCKICDRFPGAECGYQFWTTRQTFGYPEQPQKCVADVRRIGNPHQWRQTCGNGQFQRLAPYRRFY